MVRGFSFLLLLLSVVLTAQSQSDPPSADVVLKQAFSKAKAEKKNVFIIFHASWCGWCKKMDAAMNDSTCKKYFTDNYVIEHLTVMENIDHKHLENPGAEDLFIKYAPMSSGIPFWLIYDADGNLIADSKLPDGSNIGCPAAKSEVDHFIALLKKSSSLNDKMAKIVYDRFRKNEPVRKK
ncbi:MAG TPA: thioredoxin family protein [Niabella sp.]|nr:thioredoxin family protein [Niabella sp.]HOZ95572.1 thioredoxin family protein [Niabella sp.]HQW13812.1 thioredoxin family protein [Niabella sp.]HQX19295.1 thioredoxin family protein [Niabella sp.]HQX41647.1 thioredoxin family protein [Niabella sp.]